MVPFYGQGLNCALEDVRILSILLRKEKDGHDPLVIRRVLDHYSETRHEDLVAICDLAMDSQYVLTLVLFSATHGLKSQPQNAAQCSHLVLHGPGIHRQYSLRNIGVAVSRGPIGDNLWPAGAVLELVAPLQHGVLQARHKLFRRQEEG